MMYSKHDSFGFEFLLVNSQLLYTRQSFLPHTPLRLYLLLHHEGKVHDEAKQLLLAGSIGSILASAAFPRLFIISPAISAGNRVRPPFLLPFHPTLWFPPILIPPRPHFSIDLFLRFPSFFPPRRDCLSLRTRIFT